jgi:hypothetical protein
LRYFGSFKERSNAATLARRGKLAARRKVRRKVVRADEERMIVKSSSDGNCEIGLVE